jgi:peptidoglycan/LPS O-acetylase OafA/YrhL
MVNKLKIQTLGLLRGIAVLAVCFRHFGKPVSTGVAFHHFFSWIGENGKYGVQIFFVISGFVIPYSLFKANYKLKHYFKFLYKRALRLHPPYLAALLITLVIAYLSYKARHLANPETITSVLLSIFYIHVPADNPVFWTLQIEAEYYIFIGLFFILLMRMPKASILISIPVILWLSQTQVANYISLLNFIVFFLIGTVGYLIYIKEKNKMLEYIALFILIVFSFMFYDLIGAIASVCTILVILFYRKPIHSALEFPGEISYSLYLIHFVIGVKIINLLQHHIGPNYNWVAFLLALVICIGASWVFWKFIEKPSAELSNKVKYGKKKTEFLNYDLETEKTK